MVNNNGGFNKNLHWGINTYLKRIIFPDGNYRTDTMVGFPDSLSLK
jgi:hypothetical protein